MESGNSSQSKSQSADATEGDKALTNVSKIGSTLLCSECEVIFQREKNFETFSSKTGLRFSRGRENTIRNAIDGCRFCQEILCIPYSYVSEYWERVDREKGVAARSTESKENGGWPIELWKSKLSLLEPRDPTAKPISSDGNMEFSIKGDTRWGPLTLVKHRRLWFAKKMDFDIKAHSNDPVAQEVVHRIIDRAVECDSTYRDIRNHLQQKSWDSIKRGASTGSYTPPILIDVQDVDGTVRLHQPRSKDYPAYAALSFAWGASQLMTTKSNFDAHFDHIQLEAISKTVQDAILVTRALHLRYLWVDTLCIIQDSEEDKLNKTKLLGHIFHNAYVSIIANCAKTCNDGFLKETRVRTRFELPYRASNDQIGTISLTAVKPQSPNEQVEPLQTRAWAWQELCLSKAYIMYNSDRIDWGSEGNPGKFFFGINGWTTALSTHSGKALTDPCDKLPAISSLAWSFSASLKGSKYLAGIFSAESHHQLCWYGATGKQLIRPQAWRAPSWSPMAVDGPIEQWHCWTDKAKVAPFLVDNQGEYHCDFEILDANIEVLTPKAPFGKVTSGYLQVKGRLMQVHTSTLLGLGRIGNILGGLGVVMQSAAFKPGRVGTMYFDTVNSFGTRIASADSIQTNYGPLNENTELACLAICKKKVVRIATDSETNKTTYTIQRWDAGLVLAKLENGEYHRVGHFLCNKNDVFPGQFELQVLRIV